jgi:hypothetical protein
VYAIPLAAAFRPTQVFSTIGSRAFRQVAAMPNNAVSRTTHTDAAPLSGSMLPPPRGVTTLLRISALGAMTRRWLQWLKSTSALPFRAPRIIYIERQKYVLRGRRWFRSTEALERYINERGKGQLAPPCRRQSR